MVIDKTYSVRWYGPFKTPDEVKAFEDNNKDLRFQLYVLNGYKPHAKIYNHYYCGQTQRSVYKRLTDENHHINEFREILAIWIGSISNVEPAHKDINVVEKILTAQLRFSYGERFLLNQTNTKFPTYNAYVLNIWHSTKGLRISTYQKSSLPSELPDVIGHEYDKELDAHMLFDASKITWRDIE